MKVTYTPANEDVQTWDFKPGDLRESRGEMIEKRWVKLSGDKQFGSLDGWMMFVQLGNASARRVLLWHLLNSVHPTLQIEDVDPLRKELLVELDLDELVAHRDMLTKADLDESQRQVALAQVDAQIAEAQDEGKALSPSSEPATGA